MCLGRISSSEGWGTFHGRTVWLLRVLCRHLQVRFRSSSDGWLPYRFPFVSLLGRVALENLCFFTSCLPSLDERVPGSGGILKLEPKQLASLSHVIQSQ